MNRTNGLTDQMHGYVGAMMFFSFCAGTVQLIGAFIPSMLVFLALVVIVSVFTGYLLSSITRDRIEASRHLFPEDAKIPRYKFLESGEVKEMIMLANLCMMLGFIVSTTILQVLLFNMISSLIILSGVFCLVLILVAHSRMSRMIHKNDVCGVSYIHKYKKMKEAEV